jgi:hypothetical protein
MPRRGFVNLKYPCPEYNGGGFKAVKVISEWLGTEKGSGAGTPAFGFSFLLWEVCITTT